ncbi:DMT family transporter [Alteribacter natronophilus]|uniref:DMT family transporter n=1 Tax=Alteribacter natronophilus TaxID=2583810 RepID=UPI00110D405C|nr:DMT family transporter [Alteribacter natronophilus]TMW72753.1 DMT family transporter [Alteribacter natronophilus]
MNSETKGHLLNTASVIMVAIGPLLAKFGLGSVQPAQAAVINTVTIILASLLYGFAAGRPVTFYREKKVMALALFNTLGVIFLFLSLDLLSPVQIGFLGRFYTVFAVLLSVVLLREVLTKREWGWIGAALAGVFLFVESGSGYTGQLTGTMFALMYTFFFALTNIYIKRTLSDRREPNSLLFTSNTVTLAGVLLYAGISGGITSSSWSVSGTALIVLSSLCSGFVGTILLYEALKYLRFSIANATRAFSPVLLAVISYPFFPVPITWQNTAGAVILVGSILFLSRQGKTKSSD